MSRIIYFNLFVNPYPESAQFHDRQEYKIYTVLLDENKVRFG